MKTWQVLSNIPDFVAVWAVFLYGVHWITARREDVAKATANGNGRNGQGHGREDRS
jgi:hypothetical protein